MDVRDLIRRDVSAAEHAEIRELWKRHSIAEDERDLPGLMSTLTDDCVCELRPGLTVSTYFDESAHLA